MLRPTQAFALFAQRMQEEQLPEPLINAFARLYGRYLAGETGKIAWNELAPPDPEDIVDYAALSEEDAQRGQQLLDQLVVRDKVEAVYCSNQI